MKGKMLMSALFALMLVMGISVMADAAPYGRYRRGPGCRPRCGVVRVVPPRPPRVVVYGGHYGHYYGGSYGHHHGGYGHHHGGYGNGHHHGGGYGHRR